jgi:chromosome segregation ATPase
MCHETFPGYKRLTPDTRNGDDLLQENARLKQELRKCQEESVIEYNGLRDEYNEAVDLYNAAQERIQKLKDKNGVLKQKTEDLQDEVTDLEQERDVEARRAKEKTQKIRDMVKERDDLQKKLAEVAEKANKVHVSLNYEAKQSIAASTRLDKQLGDETFRRAMDQIFERFRECFLTVRRKQEFGQFQRT